MIIRNVSRHDLDAALEIANWQFSGNVKYKRCDRTTQYHYPLSGQFDVYTMPGTYRVTLTVADSSEPGSRRSTNRYRADGSLARIAAACWHAHGAFMEALPPQAVVISSPMIVDAKPTKWSPGEPLQDFSIGSQMYPCMASEACEC